MNPILAVIIACEIGFWVFVVLGLATRYVLGRRRLGGALLVVAPVVDLVLLTAVVISLRSGETASLSHSLAALYLGVSIAYGHSMVSWADARFAHHFAGGQAPAKLYAQEYAKKCWTDVVRTSVAVGIAAGIIWSLRLLVDDSTRTEELLGIYPILGIWFAIDLLWAVNYTVFPKKSPVRAA